MTVRAVDMQTMIPRLNEASRMQHHNDQQPSVASQAQAATLQQRAERAQQQVTQKSNAGKASIQKDGKGQGGGAQAQQQGKGQAKGQAEQGGQGKPRSVTRLDVKV